MQKIRTANNGFAKRRPQSNFRSRAGHNTFRPNGNYSRNRRSNGGGIDINGFIEKSIKKAAEPIQKVAIQHTFNDFDFSVEIKRNLAHRGYKVPTPIQDQSIKPILAGKDLVGMANTGTGKTAAFLLPMIEKVFKNRNEKVLIIAPTRELALQIETELREFSYGMKMFYATCVGGMPIYRQIRDIKMKRPNFIIGTPGRIRDLSKRGLIDFGSFRSVVLDEVDRMLDMGFVDEIKYFLGELPKERQSLYFSATMPPRIKMLIETFSSDPVVVQVKAQDVSANVKQEVIRVGHNMKFEKLKEVLSEPGSSRVLIFSETKRDVEKLSTELSSHGFKADSIHGDKRQSQRQRALDNFKCSKVNILVATDVAARGLDIKEVTHVINYTVPQTFEDYIHRIGRTGRGNSQGKALTFVA
jgi:superfamily II DNA/RNA helicase